MLVRSFGEVTRKYSPYKSQEAGHLWRVQFAMLNFYQRRYPALAGRALLPACLAPKHYGYYYGARACCEQD
jgi:hypothetical protein